MADASATLEADTHESKCQDVQGSSAAPTGIWSWEDYKKAGPLLVSLNHPGTGMDGKPLQVFFSDVAVKVVGGANMWAKAH